MKLKYSLLFFGIFSIILISCFILKHETTTSENTYKISVHKVENGYGYTISEQENIIIKQEFIPAIQKQIPFPTEDIARASAELVIKKITTGQHPALSLKELDQIGVEVYEE